MASRLLFRSFLLLLLTLICFSTATLRGQGAQQTVRETKIANSDRDHVRERNAWFYRGRIVRGAPAAELRRRAYQWKLRMRARRAEALAAGISDRETSSPSSGSWRPLGPLPLASDASGNGTQDYHQVTGRATAVAIDPADGSGNTLYIGGAQGGVWKSTNAANATANNVTWTPLTDAQATLSIGAIAIQTGNSDVTKSVILAATGEGNNSGDSYFGLGILRSVDAGSTWSLISTANNGALSFSGLGGTRMAFSTMSPNTVVAAMATTAEGMNDGAITANTKRGLYTSVNAGQTWTYSALVDPGGATDATSATSVAYNAAAGIFLAAVRYHGFYSSADGLNWTRLANQPGGSVLSAGACPPQSAVNNYACPIYRGEITVVPGRNEMYVWYIYLSTAGEPVDGGIWQSLDSGASWTSIADDGIANCGDFDGCGVEQGDYNLEILAVPDCPGGASTCTGNPTDLYAGAVNLYKCSLPTSTSAPACSHGFLNLTHVYGCDPIAAPSHVHPDQHALAYVIPSLSSAALMYFANDGGIYRALDGFSFSGSGGSCSAINAFDDLNQNLGPMTQFVSFSQHPTDANTILGGTQDNGSPASNQATSSTSWFNVLSGDGGYNAIDPTAASNWYASNPDIPPGGLGVQLCPNGVSCNNAGFNFVITSSTVGGDDGAFYFPYILDPRSSSAMLVGTCRVWRGPRTGGTFTVLSPNFDSFGSGTCTGNEVNQVRALAVGGSADENGSAVVYATTSGLGPIDGPLSSPTGGQVWVTTDASAGIASFTNVTNNGPQGSINPNQYPISGVATDSSDSSGSTAYVTVMGFTGGAGHVWKTNNAGATWTDFTGNLPDSPANAVVVYPPMSSVYVATDVGVFVSPTSSPNWTELGPNPNSGQTGFLPNVAVTALGIFASGGQQLLRASTYGRGMWQFNLVTTSDFELYLSNSPQSVSVGQNAIFNGTANALNGYSSSVTLSCVPGATAPPSVCSPSPSTLTPGVNTAFTVSASGAVNDYYFNVQGKGSDANSTTHQVPAVLHVVGNGGDFGLSPLGAFPTVNAGSTTMGGTISVTGTNGFSGTITLSCSLISGNGSCSVTPATVTTLPSTPTVTVNASNLSAGSYQLLVSGVSGTITHTLLVPFNVGDYQFSPQNGESVSIGVGRTGTATLSIVSTDYAGNVNASCDTSNLPGATCAVSPNPIPVSAGATVPVAAAITVTPGTALGNYSVRVNTHDTSGNPSHTFTVTVTVTESFTVIPPSPNSQSVNPGQTTAAYILTIKPTGARFDYPVSLSCSSGLPAGAQCAFNPSTPVTPGASTPTIALSISTNPTTLAGVYPVTITASSPIMSTTAIVLLDVNDYFLLAVSQSFPAYVNAGSTETAVVSVTPNYSASITGNCSIPSSIAGAQCEVTPSYPLQIGTNQTGTLTVTLSVPSATASGAYIDLVATDSAAGLSPTQRLPIEVEDFKIDSATPSQTVGAGQTSNAYTLTVGPAKASFDSAIEFSCSAGLPSGALCLFVPQTVTPSATPQKVALTISTSAATVLGTYPITITATSGSLSHPLSSVSLVVASSTIVPDFQLAVKQSFPSTVGGSKVTALVGITGNYSGSVDATCNVGALPGTQCVLEPGSPFSITANAATTLTVALTIPNSTAPKSYSVGLSIADRSGQPTHTLQLPVTVIQDFSVTSATPSQAVNPGQTTGAYQLTIAPNPAGSSFPGAVTLACKGLPAGAQCLFSPSGPQTPNDSAVNLVMSISTAAAGAASQPPSGGFLLYAVWLLPALAVGSGWRTRRVKAKLGSAAMTAVSLFLLVFIVSCAGVSNGGSGSSSTNPTTYKVTVTGTSPGTPPEPGHSTVVTLVVN